MKVEKIEPRVVVYALHPGKEDKEYHMCMWAKFIFDCDSGHLNINSDAGDYSYRWGYNENEDFLHLMTRINKDYLLNKISDQSVFDDEKSKEETIKAVKKSGMSYMGIRDRKHMYEIINQINDIEYGCSEEYFIREIDSIIPQIDYEDIEVIKEYPHGAMVVVDLFEKYIQPKIKEDAMKL